MRGDWDSDRNEASPWCSHVRACGRWLAAVVGGRESLTGKRIKSSTVALLSPSFQQTGHKASVSTETLDCCCLFEIYFAHNA